MSHRVRWLYDESNKLAKRIKFTEIDDGEWENTGIEAWSDLAEWYEMPEVYRVFEDDAAGWPIFGWIWIFVGISTSDGDLEMSGSFVVLIDWWDKGDWFFLNQYFLPIVLAKLECVDVLTFFDDEVPEWV